MFVDLRYAGLEPDIERRVRFAANGLAAFRLNVKASAWDGTRCDILVTDANDAYGLTVVDIARRRDMRIVAFTREPDRKESWANWIDHGTSVAALTKILQQALADSTDGDAEDNVDDTSLTSTAKKEIGISHDSSSVGMVRLALDESLRNATLAATHGGRTLLFRLRAGRVLASSLSDMLFVRDHICDSGWKFRALDASRLPDNFEIGASLDSFFLESATRNQHHLPSFPEGRYWLCDWPDLGQAPELVNALSIVRILLREKVSVRQLCKQSGLGATEVSACLWAFCASGLLQRTGFAAQALPPPPTAGRFTTLMSRLASHLGLAAR